MNKLLTLRKRLADLIQEEEVLLDKLVGEARDATPEEETRLTEIETQKKSASKMIERVTRIDEERAAMGDDLDDEDEDENRGGNGGTPAAQPRIRITRGEGENDKGQYVPFKNFGEQLQTIRRAAAQPHQVDKRLLEMNKRAAAGLNEQVGSEGGFLLQVDYSAELMQASIETGLLAPRCRRFPVSAGATGIEFPMVDETSRADGSRFGGIQVYWAAEAEAAQKSKPKFRIDRLTFQKLLGMAVVTDEMLKDAPFLGAFISQAFSEEFAYKIDDGIVRGTGVGQMLGYLNSGALVTVSKESGPQAADTILGVNVTKMRARLLARARKGAVWLTNQDCEPQIQTLTITKDKSDIPLYVPADGLNRPLDKVYGHDVVPIEQASTLGDLGDLSLVDLSYYALITQDAQSASSIHAYFDTEQTAFRFSMRINGQPMMKQPITPARGTNTLSAFVTLEAR